MQILQNLGLRNINIGLALGLTFGGIILLRPVTNRLLRPKYRVILWMLGWFLCYFWSGYESLGFLRLLPFSFRDLITARTCGAGMSSIPAFVPEHITRSGTYLLALPGGTAVPVTVSKEFGTLFALASLAIWVGLLVWCRRRGKQLTQLSRAGERLDPERLDGYGVNPEIVAVRICERLPASFVYRGRDSKDDPPAMHDVICLQKELPEEQMELVLRHEVEHIRQSHTYYKAVMVAMMCLFWWNPLFWAAYRLTSRDMELACDEAVMAKLDGKQRRNYARALVELASGKHLWSGLTSFGECDAALRVRRVVRWTPQKKWGKGLSILLLGVLILFFYCGGPKNLDLPGERDLAWQRQVLVPEVVELPPSRYFRSEASETLRVTEIWTRADKEEAERNGWLYGKTEDGRWLIFELLWYNSYQEYQYIHASENHSFRELLEKDLVVRLK